MTGPIPTWTRVALDQVDSTSAHLKRELQAGRLGRAAVTSRVQSAGRGRRGRTWLSPAGGLYLTVSLPLPRSGPPPILHAVAGGLAVSDLLRDELALPTARLKWPNDILIDERKVCGLLAELVPVLDGDTWILLGIGLNVTVVPDAPDLEYTATSLAAETGRDDLELEPLADALLACLAHRLAQLAAAGTPPLLDAWRDRSATLGQAVQVTGPTGITRGRATDITSEFALVVETEAGPVNVEVGDCLHLRVSATEPEEF